MTDRNNLSSIGGNSKKKAPGSLLVGSLDINILLAFTFGVIFLLVMLAFATRFENPTVFQIQVFMTVLSLAAAGVGAVLPGNMEVQYKGFLRAGGALALFVVVWFSKPVIEQTVVKLKEPTESPEIAVSRFLSDLDAGGIAQTYADLDPDRQSQVSQAIWGQLYDANTKPLGAVLGRKLMSVDGGNSPPNLPVGVYRSRTFLAHYSNTNGCRVENVVVKATQDNSWKVYGYQISPSDVPCSQGIQTQPDATAPSRD